MLVLSLEMLRFREGALMYITTYREEFLEGIVKLWNDCFSGERNFLKMTGERMQDYCLKRKDFNPDGFFVAVDANEVIGLGLAGYGKRGEDRGRGIIHLLVVKPSWRRRGVGGRLLKACESYLPESKEVVIGAMGLDIFFSHTRSSLLPAWGSSEGIGLHAEDLETRMFLEKRGYKILDTLFSMVLNLRERPPRGGIKEPRLRIIKDRWVFVGERVEESTHRYWHGPCESLAYVENGVVKGKIVSYPMTKLEPGREAIIDFFVDPACRGMGVGSLLLDAELSLMSSRGAHLCELTVSPMNSERAFQMYKKRGFQIAARWCSYCKKL